MKRSHNHSVDIFFTISLFFVFTFCSLAVIVFGANVYKNTAEDMQENFTARTAVAYVTEKVRQNDKKSAVALLTQDGMDVLRIKTLSTEQGDFVTYIYCKEDGLYELLYPADREFNPAAGQKILEISAFSVKELTPSLLEISCEDASGNVSVVNLGTRAS